MKNELGMDIAKLGFGLMRLPMVGEEFDIDQIKRMIDTCMGNGFTYFDTAYVYANGKSEIIAGDLLVNRYPRESFVLATKLPMWLINQEDDMERIFSEQLDRTGAGYFDFYMVHGTIHNVPDRFRFSTSSVARIKEFGAWEFLKQKKAEGKIKHIGFSFHDTADALDQLLTDFPEAEFVQLQINYADWEDPIIQSRKCYEVARKHLKPIIVMEPVKGGTLVNLRSDVERILKQANPGASLASWAIRFATSLDGVITVLSGMSNMEQLLDNISYMKTPIPLTEEERNTIEATTKAFKEIDLVGCTACRYCTDDCPQKINIPSIFSQLNEYRMYRNEWLSRHRYQNTVYDTGKASACIACGSCESHCPQKLDIIQLLKEAALQFEQ